MNKFYNQLIKDIKSGKIKILEKGGKKNVL
jgi:hypothetical protein